MKTVIEIYRGGSMELVRTVSLAEVLQPSVARITGLPIENTFIYLELWQVEEERTELLGIYNMAPSMGYATVSVIEVERKQVIYQHPHPVSELFCAQLRELIDREIPGQARWGFRLVGAGIPETQVLIPPPPVVGAFDTVRPPGFDRPRFRISPVPDPPTPRVSLRDFHLVAPPLEQSDALVKVLVHESVKRDLKHGRPFSEKVEEGGFLVGRVFEDAEQPGTFIVEVTGAPRAEHTGASLLHLTFTGDSFSEIKRRLREDLADQRLVGWYHTHVFPASVPMGLSSIDLELHFTTFRQPWQLAGLINLDGNGKRTLRFYVEKERLMVPCPQWEVLDPKPGIVTRL
jgi:hypothetical protein